MGRHFILEKQQRKGQGWRTVLQQAGPGGEAGCLPGKEVREDFKTQEESIHTVSDASLREF